MQAPFLCQGSIGSRIYGYFLFPDTDWNAYELLVTIYYSDLELSSCIAAAATAEAAAAAATTAAANSSSKHKH